MQKMIGNIAELKELSVEELSNEAKVIREFLINSVAKTGGHIGSNLGVVELTLALHYYYNSPKDKLIFDVGHQCYTHKILTGRADRFDTLRQHDGLSGFIKREESIHDVWEAGHSSTSISAAAGFAYANRQNNNHDHVIAIVGDGSLTNGMALEALNHIVEENLNVLIIINDNEMSISPNVGFIDNILKDLQISTDYKITKKKVHGILGHTTLGNKLANQISKLKHLLKVKISANQNFFNLMGYYYFGPIDGHDISQILKMLKKMENIQGPKILHVKTNKGQGYEPAIINNWHGVGPFDVKTGKILKEKQGYTYSAIVANYVEKLMRKDKDIIVITPAMLGGSELDKMKANYPNRVTDVGIAEEHALTFAGSLAVANKKPFVAIYSTFLQRAYDQVFHDICRIKANVVIGIDRAGLVGDDGETHQGIYDISFLSHMPNMTVVMGCNEEETISLLDYCFNVHQGPIAIRYPRGGCGNQEMIDNPTLNITNLNWVIKKQATKNYIITYGTLVDECLKVFENTVIGIINARVIHPIDHKMLQELKGYNFVVIEEHAKFGNLYSLITDDYPTYKVSELNLGNNFIKQGNVEIIKTNYNLKGDNLKKAVESLLNV